MKIFLIGLAFVILVSLIIMILYGVYFLISTFQAAKIKLYIQDLWRFCSYAYYFMDDNKRKIFSERLKKELNRSIEEPKEDNKIELNRILRLKQTRDYINILYEDLVKKVKKSLPLARAASDEEIYEINNVVNIIKDVLKEI